MKKNLEKKSEIFRFLLRKIQNFLSKSQKKIGEKNRDFFQNDFSRWWKNIFRWDFFKVHLKIQENRFEAISERSWQFKMQKQLVTNKNSLSGPIQKNDANLVMLNDDPKTHIVWTLEARKRRLHTSRGWKARSRIAMAFSK